MTAGRVWVPALVIALLAAAVTSPRWVMAFVKMDGSSQHVWVRDEIPGYGWHPDKLDEGTLLHYEGCTLLNGIYSAPAGRGITAFAATWTTGKGADLVNGPHTPDVCYPAVGASRVKSDPDRVSLTIADQTFGFGRRLYRDSQGRMSLIYYTHLLGGTLPLEVSQRSWTRVMLALRLKADRRRDQLYLLVTTPVGGDADLAAADAAVREFLPKWITVNAAPSPAAPPVAAVPAP